MKKFFTLLTLIGLSTCALKVSAQNGFSELIKSGPGDATKLINAYGEPLFKGFGVGMNSGWNNTAKTKKFLAFDLRVTASAAFVPSSDKTFDVTKLGLSSKVRVKPGSPNFTPTLGGTKASPTTLEIFDDKNNKIDEFVMPEGKTSFIPAPQLQLTVGILQNTDVTLRAIPKIKMGDDIGSVSMIGFGIKHDIIQDFAGGAGKLIPFNLAIGLGYTRLNVDIPLDVQPEPGSIPAPGTPAADFSNQHIDGHFDAFQIQAIVSKKLTVFTPFFSVAYNTSKTKASTIGNYPINTGEIAGQNYYESFNNPINIKETSINGLRADLGFQLELSFFRFYASYSAAEYHSVNAGIGFGI
jgi:hypothetical protein